MCVNSCVNSIVPTHIMQIYGRRNVQSVSIQVLLFANQQELIQMPYARHNQLGSVTCAVSSAPICHVTHTYHFWVVCRMHNTEIIYSTVKTEPKKKIREAKVVRKLMNTDSHWFCYKTLGCFGLQVGFLVLSVGLRKPRTERNRKSFLLPFL